MHEETQWPEDSKEDEIPTERKFSDSSTAPTLIDDEKEDSDVTRIEKETDNEKEKDDEIDKLGAKKIVKHNFEKERKNRKVQLIVPLATELQACSKAANNNEKEIEKDDVQFLSRISLKMTVKEKKLSGQKKVLTMKEW
ncbi:uncharacterized protein MONOS_6303 [Monocercomonoides exilis]|uniref:uncharacterized protein n=1 Tax=Monocercomonoides exilis TaxID=2049356 RepID=UPI00355A4736|nr:hypothetical protein MONOS_6303 [Monocercomonoides exilis]|eukprot:MONOS_6303.1-p1 / transcript=MONOS_6303.1 / gene=MONOS_6303 / organism=Monocercomonoides_exilis_PA203 / gene_product=unspecified product / transcript_product=unspecified product / location=Mono_scaffold00196:81985-82464(-) / protein_length=139 / sequence_SO=supercontig / SO=protein_coding / is_pseudo=false